MNQNLYKVCQGMYKIKTYIKRDKDQIFFFLDNLY